MSGRWPSRLSRDQAGVKEILFFFDSRVYGVGVPDTAVIRRIL